MDDLFHFLSRLVIVIPVAIVILALVLKFNQKKENYPPKILPKSTATPTTPVSPSAKFDLAGPLVCQINEKQATISAYIKNKKIKVIVTEKTKTSNFLLNGDCLYIWEKNNYLGNKKCGLSSYIKIIETMPLRNIFNIISLFGFSSPINLQNNQNFLNSCEKKEINKENIFEIPVDSHFP